MTTQTYTDGVTLTAAAEFNRFDTVSYAVLGTVAGTNTITAAGPANYTYAATTPPVWFIPAVTNTGATTINITPSGSAALGAKNIFWNGAACVGGELPAGVPVGIIYDGTRFHIISGVEKVLLLKANSGTDANAGATNVDTVSISGLTAKDSLCVVTTLRSVTQQTAAIVLYNSTDGVTVSQASGNAVLAANGTCQTDSVIRQEQSGATAVLGLSNGGSNAAGLAGQLVTATFTTNWTASWTLALRHGGVTAGGTLQWSWCVYKVLGQ